jgi:hypothetical protein
VIAGIDWSTKALDVVIIPADHDHGDADLPRVTVRHAAIPQETKVHRPGHAAFLTVDLLADVAGYPVTFVFVEENFTHRTNAAVAMWPIQGAICAAAWRPGRREVALIPTNRWRKHHALPFQADKPTYVAAALTREPSLPRDITDHTAEAYLIAIAGRDILNGRTR